MNTTREGKAESGMVTSEFALVTPIYFLMVFLMLGGLVGAWRTIDVSNEAKEIAREYSIEGRTEVAAAVQSSGGQVAIDVTGDIVHVMVRRVGTGLYELAGVDFVGQHRSVIEPGARDT
ncbi:hypothetical protein, partial [Trueperella sp.]|uniref:hypothetical protein n=1 Tax=Trueperella sp. TaxID=2699835 RepID=UPI0037360B0A